jgi:hypothetical protein
MLKPSAVLRAVALVFVVSSGCVLSAQAASSPAPFPPPFPVLPSSPSAQHEFSPEPVDGVKNSSIRGSGFNVGLKSKPKRTIDRSFILMQAAAIGATMADAETTLYCIHNNTAREANPLFGATPSRARIYGTIVPITVFLAYLDYRGKKNLPHSHWKVMPAIAAIAHTAAAINNSRIILESRSGQK